MATVYPEAKLVRAMGDYRSRLHRQSVLGEFVSNVGFVLKLYGALISTVAEFKSVAGTGKKNQSALGDFRSRTRA